MHRLDKGFILIATILLLLAATLLVTSMLHTAVLNFKIAEQQINQQKLFADLETGLSEAQRLLTKDSPLLAVDNELNQTSWQKSGISLLVNNTKMHYVYQLVAERDCIQLNDKNIYRIKSI